MPSAEDTKATREGSYRPVSPDRDAVGPGAEAESAKRAKAVCVCVVGGKNILRKAIRKLLESDEIAVAEDYRDETAFAAALDSGAGGFDMILMFLGSGRFSSLHHYSNLMAQRPSQPPVVILSDNLSRGGVYSAIRMGAKAFVTLDSQPQELRHAILLAAEGKMHLSHDAAELMITDMKDGSRRQPGRAGAELSARETEVVQLLCEGLSSKQIAQRLHVSPKTVENHRYNIYRKCQVDSIACLIRHAIQQGIVSL